MASQAFVYSEALLLEVRGSLFFAHVFCAENGFYTVFDWIVGHSLITAGLPSRSEQATSQFSKTRQVSSLAR